MAGQTSYNTAPDAAFPGMPVDNGPSDTVSVTNEEATGLRAGIMVVQGTESDDVLLPSAAGDDQLGVLMHMYNSDPDLASPLIVSADGLGDVRRKGRVWVRCEEAITLGDDVYFRHTANGGNTVLGMFRNDADAGNADQVTAARWAGPSQTLNSVILAPLDLNLV